VRCSRRARRPPGPGARVRGVTARRGGRHTGRSCLLGCLPPACAGARRSLGPGAGGRARAGRHGRERSAVHLLADVGTTRGATIAAWYGRRASPIRFSAIAWAVPVTYASQSAANRAFDCPAGGTLCPLRPLLTLAPAPTADLPWQLPSPTESRHPGSYRTCHRRAGSRCPRRLAVPNPPPYPERRHQGRAG